MRHAYEYCKWLWHLSEFIREKKLFRDITLTGRAPAGGSAAAGGGGGGKTAIRPSAAGASSNASGAAAAPRRAKVLWKAVLRVGSGKNAGTDGSGLSWKFSLLERPSAFFERLQLPPDSGSCVSIDFHQRLDVDEMDVKRTANYMKKMLSHHFTEQLTASPQFKGVFVFPAVNETDGTAVIRCAICYKRQASIDMFLEQLQIQCMLSDIITVCNGSIYTNVHISEIFDAARSAIDDKVSISVRKL